MRTRSSATPTPTPARLGYAMPAEWERHEATWLAWPHNESDWPGKLDAVRWAYAEMARKIAAGERVRLLVRHRAEAQHARRYLARAHCDLRRVDFIVHPTDRSWTRDSGPIFVKRRGGARGDTAIVHFHFNAWAKYRNWRRDTRVPETAARVLNKRLFDARVNGRAFVLEGGGIEVNGHGTLLSTEECYLHPRIQVRNPGLSRAGYEEAFRRYLGVSRVFWLASGPVGDDTHGHIDDICRFVNRRTLVLVRETRRGDPNYRRLAENWERIRDLRLEDGSRPEVVPLPMPAPLFFGRWRLPASYANFYFCNAGLLVPTFNDPNDRIALGTLAELVRDRPVIGIHAVDLVLGFGSLHCLTQQQPA
jgi:agmatine deiminase